jgi:integrase
LLAALLCQMQAVEPQALCASGGDEVLWLMANGAVAGFAHWMRRLHASHAIAGGMPIEIAQQNPGHASLATTTVYVTTEKRRRMKAVEVRIKWQ